MNFKRFWKWQYIVPAVIVAAPIVIGLVVLVFGGIVMLLWNWLLPPLFDIPRINVWQGFGLLVLGRLLFGGFGHGGGGGRHSRRMTPEERERMRRRFCARRAKDEPPASLEDGGSAQSS